MMGAMRTLSGWLLTIVLLGPAAAVVGAAETAELKALVDASKFEEALNAIEAARDASAAGFYNRGYLAFRMGQTGRSVAYFEKAAQLAPSDEDTRHNLLLARNRLMSETGLKTLDPSSTPIERIADGVPLEGVKNVWGLMSLLLVFAWVRGFSIKKSLRYAVFRPVAVILALAWGATTAVWGLGKSPSRHPKVVAIEATVVRSGPGTNYTELAKLVAGVKISRLEGYQPGWWQVRYESDALGWVEEKAFLLL